MSGNTCLRRRKANGLQSGAGARLSLDINLPKVKPIRHSPLATGQAGLVKTYFRLYLAAYLSLIASQASATLSKVLESMPTETASSRIPRYAGSTPLPQAAFSAAVGLVIVLPSLTIISLETI